MQNFEQLCRSLQPSELAFFNNRHFIIDGENSTAPLPVGCGTHDFVWDRIEYFGAQNNLGVLFASIIQPYGRTLGNWLAPIAQAREWFLQWNQDRRLFSPSPTMIARMVCRAMTFAISLIAIFTFRRSWYLALSVRLAAQATRSDHIAPLGRMQMN